MMEIIGEEKLLKNKDFRNRSLKNLKQRVERLLGRRSVTITEYDPTYKVVYLGNVLTGWAKGDSCTEKPLNTLWRNYTSTSKVDVQMKLIVTQSGLKAITKQHGLTEYWSHRITYCCAPAELPKIFCWVYRHEGRKLKQELRCHAVLCPKESAARQIANQLQARLAQALVEFKREKVSRQNARLSLANSVYDNPSLPRRKILLSTGSHNYRPPLERSQSAPKLMSIEESLEEEENVDCKKAPKRLIETKGKFATCRNLNFSTRGHRLGGLQGLRYRPTTDPFLSMPAKLETPQISSQYKRNEDDSENIVEENPFGFDLMQELEKRLSLQEQEGDVCQQVTDINENICDTNSPFFLPERWSKTAEEDFSSCPTYNESTTTIAKQSPSSCEYSVNECDSLVRNRRKMFENGQRSFECKRNVTEDSPIKNLVKCRRKMFECGHFCDANSNLQFDLSEENRDSVGLECLTSADDESSPSLQSISSSSDTSSSRDMKIEYVKNCDLDSLWEEDSDESGFVEPVGQDARDDKIRDLPHTQLVKSCILLSKNHCVEV